jgi:hypothetical protein
MKKSVKLTCILLVICLIASAKEVDLNTASIVAKNFYYQNVGITNGISYQNINPSMVYECTYKTESSNFKETEPLYFIFNVNENTGFVIVSGDDIVVPVLGYSNEGTYEHNNQPPAFRKWMEGYKAQIIFAKKQNLAQTKEITQEWNNLITNQANTYLRGTNSVTELLSTTWNQSPYYNSLCPGGSVTGCVATAMAQIMKFWNYPSHGYGIHSYNEDDYGTLTANFGATTYNWTSMPNTVTSSNSSVATLMYHCGVSVDMNYSPTFSGAWVISDNPKDKEKCAEYALKTYFGYKSSLSGKQKSNYTEAQWISLLKTELDASRPIIYAGWESGGGGHCFISDGYDINNKFHFNWGWGGSSDGYFYVSNLNPSILYPINQQALIGIEPSTQTANIELNSSITVSPSPINFGQEYIVNADVINKGSTSFSGYFCAALFSSSGTFIDYIWTWSCVSSPLQPNYHYTGGLDFTDTIRAVPGTYKIGIYYRTVDGEWILAGGSYTNPKSFTIKGPLNDIDLNSNIQVNPTTLVQGKSATVYADLLNDGSSTFYGTYQAALVDITGKTIVETIDIYDETSGLPSNYHYTSPISFSSGAITSDPGTYLLAILVKNSTDQYYWYASGDLYTNPIYIIVTAPPYSPDTYEINDIISQSYTLPLSFSGNDASITTTGSNCHIGTDKDFYKLNLAEGYDYTITARLHDAFNSSNGKDYTLDAIFSYSKDGTSWSDGYDDVMPGNIIFNNGGILYFLVTPYFTGSPGTYLLDIHVERTVNLPDLIVLNESITPLIVEKGSTISASCTVKNQGNGQSNSNYLKYYLSSNSSWSIDDIELGSSNIGILNYNSTSGLNKNLIIPVSIVTGTWYFLFKADANSEITEVNENNNIAYVQISVTPNSSINDFLTEDMIKIFPNPAFDFVEIQLSNELVNCKSIRLINTFGQVLAIHETENHQNFRFDISDKASGIYFIELVLSDQSITRKLLINK